MGKIIHGNKNFGYAEIDSSNPGALKFKTPVMLPGLVSTEIEVEQSATTVFADNTTYAIVKGGKVRNMKAVFRNITEAYALLLGFKKQTNGMLVDSGVFPPHCVFFETEEYDSDTGATEPTLHYVYSVVGSEPKKSSQTDEEEVEAQEIEVEYKASQSAIAKDSDGEYVQYGYITRTAQNKNLYDTFKQKVLLPIDSVV